MRQTPAARASLVERVRRRLARRKNVQEKRMFGSTAFLLNGNLLVCVRQGSLLARLGAEGAEEALKEQHVKQFDITGRGAMKGWVVVAAAGVEDDDRLADWIGRALQWVGKLPAK